MKDFCVKLVYMGYTNVYNNKDIAFTYFKNIIKIKAKYIKVLTLPLLYNKEYDIMLSS
ncbi:hypothetical protein CDLVIII_3570 [Clostridium sp. DL-VIII]|nr:hypothetical protein CDLVIII_3570 [Clostridium sp. DL-VIII]